MKIITSEDFLNLLRARITSADNQSELAAELGISRQYVWEMAAGKRPPGPRLLRALGYEKVTMYRRVK